VIYITINFPVVLYGCETWSLTLKEERRLRVLRRIFGFKRDEVTGEWRKIQNEELHDLYSSPTIVRVGASYNKNGRRIPKKVLNGNFHTTRPVGKPRTRWTGVVQRDALQLLGIKGWRRTAEYRDEW
jgi:hypothetical protein